MKNKLNKSTGILLIIVLIASMLTSLSSCVGGNGGGDNAGQGGANGENDAPHVPVVDPIDDNYRTFYQIFVGSFSDSNGDGIGDLRGIINRIDYLNDGDITSGDDLGVQGIWLSPIFSSPSYHKYDAIDYYEVDSRFGDENDLKELIELCHQRNVKIILDLVINHTSSQNKWFTEFKKARANGDVTNKYYEYYSCVTAAEREVGKSYEKISGVDAYYESNFSSEMPELNFDNPMVYDEMLGVAKYYLDLGIDGFRFDAIKYIYFEDTNANVEFWDKYMADLEAYAPDIYCVGECWSDDAEVLQYIPELNCFNFAGSGAESVYVKVAKGTNISKYVSYVESYQDKIHSIGENRMPMTFLANHDMDRIAGTFVIESQMRMCAALYLLSPGSPMIYYGEEIGLRGSRGSAMTDANRRLAMLWGDGDTVKDPIGSTYSEEYQIKTTVSSQLQDENSLLKAYQEIIAVRNRYPAIARGDYNGVTTSNNKFGGFYIEYRGEILGILHNTSMEEITIDLSTIADLDGHTFSAVLESVCGEATLNGTTLTISPRSSVILK